MQNLTPLRPQPHTSSSLYFRDKSPLSRLASSFLSAAHSSSSHCPQKSTGLAMTGSRGEKGKSLRERITSKLTAFRGSGNKENIRNDNRGQPEEGRGQLEEEDSGSESCIRRMLFSHEPSSPLLRLTEPAGGEQKQAVDRRGRRRQFQARQKRAVLLKHQRSVLLLALLRQSQMRECSFRPQFSRLPFSRPPVPPDP